MKFTVLDIGSSSARIWRASNSLQTRLQVPFDSSLACTSNFTLVWNSLLSTLLAQDANTIDLFEFEYEKKENSLEQEKYVGKIINVNSNFYLLLSISCF